MFPNPLKRNQSLQYISDLNEPLELQIYDVRGRLINQFSLESGEGNINVKQLAPATYFYRAIGSSFMKTGKLLIGE